MNETYKALHDLYFSLNEYTLAALKGHAEFMTDNNMTLEQIIKAFSEDPANTKFIEGYQELKENNSISCLEDYYEIIEYMVSEVYTEV